MKILLKRKLDRLLSKGNGEQLGWLLALTVIIITVAIIVVNVFFADDEFTWEDVVAVFIDSGYSVGPGSHYWFRLVLAILSTFVFSALLISVFTNIFDNIGEAVRGGDRRYKLKGHVLVIGKGAGLENVVSALLKKGETVVVFCEENPGFGNEVYFYRGSQTCGEDLLSASPSDASLIYIIGDDADSDHDSMNLKTLTLLKEAVPASGRKLHCFLSIREQTTKEVFQYMKNASETDGAVSGLTVDIVDEFEYQAEQLFLGTDFLPVIRQGEDMAARFIIFGCGRIAVSTAVELAHICHYPSFSAYGRRTVITMIDPDMQQCFRTMLAAHPVLFGMSHYSYTHGDGTAEEHFPEAGDDFLDIEWQFIEASGQSPLARDIVTSAASDAVSILRVLVCLEDPHQAVECALHLPQAAYRSSRTALYLNGSSEIVDLAVSTGMYGDITVFGLANPAISDPLMERRIRCGQRVNYIYDKAYGCPPATSEAEAWYSVSEADKCSSIYCACALPLRKRCFDFGEDRTPVYETEHRRWMMSALLMGYRPGPVKDKKKFIHPDIVPFDSLPEEEKTKDRILIDAADYIVAVDGN